MMTAYSSLLKESYCLVCSRWKDILLLTLLLPITIIILLLFLTLLVGLGWGINAVFGTYTGSEALVHISRSLTISGQYSHSSLKVLSHIPGAAVAVIVLLAAFLKILFQTAVHAVLANPPTKPFWSSLNEALATSVTLFPRLFMINLLNTLGTFLGLLLLLVPGIYLNSRLQLAFLVCIDERLGVIDSLQRSWQLTTNRVLFIWLNSVGLYITSGLMLSLLLLLGFSLGVTLIAGYLICIAGFAVPTAFDILLYQRLVATPIEKSIVQ